MGRKVPGSLIGIIAATALAAVLSLDELAVVGDIPRTLLLSDRLHLGSLSLDMLSDLISPVVTIAALGMIESLLCGASAARMKASPSTPIRSSSRRASATSSCPSSAACPPPRPSPARASPSNPVSRRA